MPPFFSLTLPRASCAWRSCAISASPCRASRFYRSAPAGAKVFDSLRLASNHANVGNAKTLVIHPATHQQPTADEQLVSGITANLIQVRRTESHIDQSEAQMRCFVGVIWGIETIQVHPGFQGPCSELRHCLQPIIRT